MVNRAFVANHEPDPDDSRFTIHNFTLFRWPSAYLAGLLNLSPRVTFERSRWRKLTQLVAHHVLCDVDRQMAFSVVNSKRQANHIGTDC